MTGEDIGDAHLIIVESWNDVPLKGGCSACPGVTFDATALIGNQHQQELVLQAMFDTHYAQTHHIPIFPPARSYRNTEKP